MEKIKEIILGLIILGFFMYIYTGRSVYHSEEKILLDSHKLIMGRITDYGYSAGGAGAAAEYMFKINQKKYEEPFAKKLFCIRLSKEDKRIISNTDFPVIYSPENPEISRILLRSEDYRKYGVKIPERLSSTIANYFDCK